MLFGFLCLCYLCILELSIKLKEIDELKYSKSSINDFSNQINIFMVKLNEPYIVLKWVFSVINFMTPPMIGINLYFIIHVAADNGILNGVFLIFIFALLCSILLASISRNIHTSVKSFNTCFYSMSAGNALANHVLKMRVFSIIQYIGPQRRPVSFYCVDLFPFRWIVMNCY